MTASDRAPSVAAPVVTPELGQLITELQSKGLRVEVPFETRRGGAGPADAGMLWVEGVAVTVPTGAATSPTRRSCSRREDEGWGIYRDGARLATADPLDDRGSTTWPPPTASPTGRSPCCTWTRWPAPCCRPAPTGATTTSARSAASAVAPGRPHHRQEASRPAGRGGGRRPGPRRRSTSTLTTGSTAAPDRGALYVGRCARAVKQAAGLPVEVQFEPPADLDVIDQVHDVGIDSVGIHVESFDPEVLARVAPGKARTGIDGYFRAWERAVEVFGAGQVSTYVILGMGEDPELTVDGCRRAIDIGVYPFVVPLRPVPGSLMEDCCRRRPTTSRPVYRQVVPYLVARGLGSGDVRAGCARCQACSAISALERDLASDQRLRLPLLDQH